MLPTLLNLKAIMEYTGLSRSGIYKLMSDGIFPRPIKIGRSARWRESDIEKWQADLAAGDSHE